MPGAALARLEPWLEMALLAATAVPLWRVLRMPPVRRAARRHPITTAVLVATSGALSAIGLWFALATPTRLRGLTLAALVIAFVAHRRARPAFGARRRLPPGSLGLTTSLAAIGDEAFYARAAAQWGPIFKMSQFHRPVVCIADLATGFDFLRTEAAALEQVPRPWAAVIPGGYIEFMNGPSHAHYRELLRRSLSGAVVTNCRDDITGLVREALAAAASGAAIDPAPPLARLATAILLRVFFALPPDDPDATALRRHLVAIERRLDFRWRVPRGLEADVEHAATLVSTLGRRTPVSSSVLGELLRTAPEALADPTVVRNLVFVAYNGSKSLAGTLLWLVKLCADHPRWGEALRHERETGGDALATQLTSELVRLWQSEYVYRRTLRPCVLGGYRVPRGWLVRVCVREGHARSDVFPDSSAFDPGRFAARNYGRTEYAPFSDGPHACFGAALVFTVARIFLHELAAGFTLRLDADGPVERPDNHWEHWRPSRQLRVTVAPRVAPSA